MGVAQRGSYNFFDCHTDLIQNLELFEVLKSFAAYKKDITSLVSWEYVTAVLKWNMNQRLQRTKSIQFIEAMPSILAASLQ